ncbi:hypothetical protein BGZ52_009581 [Haplosporangium bisporale]|nr:hypothetical protein BGZ52_009581 [Haplosporangium bisporale]
MVPRETEVHVMSLTQEETSAMFRAAKVHKTTVQGMLFAASIFATKAVFLSKVDKDTKIKTTTKDGILLGATVSARSLFVPPVGPFHQGNYSCSAFQRSSNKEDNVAFKVLRVFGAQDADPTNDLFNIAVATANGCLSTTTTWQKSAVKSGDQGVLRTSFSVMRVN